MEWRDLGRFFALLMLFLAARLALQLVGIEPVGTSAFESSAGLAALGTVLMAIREWRVV